MKQLLEKGSILILLGTGGVGKTTVAAALGLAAASKPLNTALITDPVSQEPTWRKAVSGAIGNSLLAKQDYAVVAYSPPTTAACPR